MHILVTGAGGFIGHHLTKRLVADGHRVVGVDLKYPEFEPTAAQTFFTADLRVSRDTACVFDSHAPFDRVYHLAADMGGIGFIETKKLEIVVHNTMINMNTIIEAHDHHATRFLFSSSACVYPGYMQDLAEASKLREKDAYPADAEDGYGWEKLYFERVCRHFGEESRLQTRVTRFHNIYGPLGTYEGGREKSPAAICRKVALAKDGDEIEIWGDGEQTRSYCYVDDCVDGLLRIMESEHTGPINLGTEELVSINQLATTVAKIAGKTIRLRHDTTKPLGVRGRNSDNSLLRQLFGWEPSTRLEDGLRATYSWIEPRTRR